MAIVKMNKFTLLTFESQKEELLRKLQGFAKVEFINLQDEKVIEKNDYLKNLSFDEVDSENAKNEENLSKAKSTLDFLINYMPKKSGLKALEDDKELLTLAELESKVEKIDWDSIYTKIKAKEDKISSLEAKSTKLEGEIEIIKPWQNLDAPFANFNGLKMSSYFLGSISKQYEEKLSKSLENSYVEIISRNSNDINVLIITNKEYEEETLNIIRGFGFSSFKTEHTEAPSKILANCQEEIGKIKNAVDAVKKELSGLEDDYNKVKLMYDYYTNLCARKKTSTNFLKTNNTVAIQGWTPVHNNESLNSLCKEVLGDSYYLEYTEVSEEEVDDVPVKLKNSLLNRTFESVTEMYSYPKYNEVDPTPLLVPFYLVFFGMMVADAGYGLLMFIVALFAMKGLKLSKQNKDFARFFLFLSIPTTLFGVAYGSFFGDALNLFANLQIKGLIDPTKDVNTILIASVALGVIQIFFGLFVKAYVLIRAKKAKDAFYDVGSWLITLVSIGLLAGSSMLGWPEVIKYVSIAGLAFGSLVIIFTGGRAEATKGAKLGQGLYALYGITGYIGDLVSYTRLMALGLAGGSIAGALNLLIGELPGVAAIVIAPILFVLAHLFNLLLGLLGAYVHTARLQYVEYFSKFYEGGGRVFSPFKASEEYMNLKDN